MLKTTPITATPGNERRLLLVAITVALVSCAALALALRAGPSFSAPRLR